MSSSRHKKTKIIRYTQEQAEKAKDKTNYSKLDSMDEKDIDYSDIPETTYELWANAKIKDPGSKKAISLRVDADVLGWFKEQGGRYQTLINRVLRRYMDAHRHH